MGLDNMIEESEAKELKKEVQNYAKKYVKKQELLQYDPK